MNTNVTRRNFLTAAGLATAGLCAFPSGWVNAAEKKKQKVLYFTRCAGFVHDPVKRKNDELAFSEKLLIELGKKAGFDVECSKDGRIFDGDLDQYDAIAFYTSGDLTKPGNSGENTPAMSTAGKQRLLDAIKAGKGFVGFHSATDSFHTPGKKDENQDQPDPYLAMLGGEFIVHGKQQVAKVKVVSPRFPGIAGMKGELSVLEEWYTHKNFAKDLHVILVQETDTMEGPMYQRPPFPAAWARMHGKGRVFYTAFGHREDIWTNPVIQEHILGGFAWALLNVDANVTPNFQSVTPKASQLKNA